MAQQPNLDPELASFLKSDLDRREMRIKNAQKQAHEAKIDYPIQWSVCPDEWLLPTLNQFFGDIPENYQCVTGQYRASRSEMKEVGWLKTFPWNSPYVWRSFKPVQFHHKKFSFQDFVLENCDRGNFFSRKVDQDPRDPSFPGEPWKWCEERLAKKIPKLIPAENLLE